MRKILVLAIAALISVSAFAQNSKSIYNKYSNKEGVSSVYVSPSMFKMMGKVPNVEGADFSSVIKSLDAMYVIECENVALASELKYDIIKYANSNKMELMMEVKDGDETVKIYTISEGDVITDFIMLASEHDECVFVGIEGKLDPQNIGQIIARLDD